MGGGGKGGGGGHTPYEAPNTLESAQKIKIIDLLCEGVVGSDVTFKNIYLDNTPIQNDDGSYNFTGIKVSALPGTHNQDYLAGFDTTDKIVSVGAEVKQDTPITRTITDPLIDSVRVTLALGSLVTMKDNGDRVGGAVSLTVMCGDKSYPVTISGKTTSAYHQDVVLTELPDTPFNISVHRNTADSTTDKVSNKTHWVSYVESIHAKFSYPHSVVVGLEIDSAQFGGKIPTRTYKNQWTQLKVPANYDPITRTYDGIWNGEFKTAWSNNPAWVFYDIVTDKRYGFGERLEGFGSDKWWLYQIAKYCDQMVPDGFGGTEPRFTCNAYLSSPRNAKSVLDDLASVFRGIAVWDGQKVIALQDAKKDPVATYTNSNVEKDGFVYSGSAKKTIFTAVHVKYIDSQTSKTQTEYVSNDDAIKRFGLNVKQITAFACTSRGQAARFGKWLIETSIREGQMVSFTVGREGIRHLPFDIIEIADNDYAGDLIGGRVLSIDGRVITIDSEITDIDSIRYYANGQSKVVDVESIDGTTITLAETPDGIEQLSVFSATKSDVKPRLFRALGIKENSGGTYTISAVTHDEDKENIVDDGVTFERENLATKHTPQISYGNVSKIGDELLIAWQGTNTSQYLIKIYKDDQLFKTYTQASPEIRLKGLSNGDYRAEIRGKSANGQLTEPVIKTWSIDYTINGLIATPELFAIKLDWTNPTTVLNKAKVEIYRSKTTFRSSATKVATLPYPTDTFTQNGIKLNETHYFWLRIIDEHGNTGDWATISGQCNDDASEIVKSISGQITKTALAQSLIDSLQADIDTAKTDAISTASADAAAKVLSEAKVRASAIEAEANQRTLAIKAESAKQTQALNTKASRLGTKITAVENVNNQQAQQIDTLTSSSVNTAAGLEEERAARVEADNAEATARNVLTARVDATESGITTLQTVVTNDRESTAQDLATLNSKVSDIELGGRNLLVDSSNYSVTNPLFSSTVASTFSVSEKVNKTCFYTKLKKNEAYLVVQLPPNIKNGKELTFSFKHHRPYASVTLFFEYGQTKQTFKTVDSSEWIHESITFIKDDANEIIIGTTSSSNRSVYVSEFKLEHGGLATDWSPTPEDMIADISGLTADLNLFKQTQATKDATKTEQLNQAVSNFNSKLNQEKTARISGDQAVNDAISSSNAKLTQLETTVSNNEAANVERLTTLGANLAKKAMRYDGNWVINKIGMGHDFVFPACSDAKAVINVLHYDLEGRIQILLNGNVVSKVSGVDAENEWKAFIVDDHINIDSDNIVRIEHDGSAQVDAGKILAVAWGSDTVSNADFQAFQSAQAAANQAQTTEINSAKSRIGRAESSISSLNNTKASKTQVATLARSTLKAEWQAAADSAEAAAKADAKAKVDKLTQTVTDNKQATASQLDALSSAIEANNLLPDPTYSKGDSEQYSKAKDSDYKRHIVYGNSVFSFTFWRLASEPDFIEKMYAESGKADVSAGLYQASVYYTGFSNANPNAYLKCFNAAGDRVMAGYEQTTTLHDVVVAGEACTREVINVQVTNSNIVAMAVAVDVAAKNNTKQAVAYVFKPQICEIATLTDTPVPFNGLDAVKAELNSFKTTQASKDVAQTTALDKAVSRIKNAESKITTLQKTAVTQDAAQSTHTIKTQAIAGGNIALAGIAMGAMANETTAESEIILMGDKLGVVANAADGTVTPMFTLVNQKAAFNGDLIVDDTILGRHIKANQTLTAPKINGGRLNINNRFIVDQYGNTTIQSATENTGLKITHEKIEVYDDAGRLRVRLGKLS